LCFLPWLILLRVEAKREIAHVTKRGPPSCGNYIVYTRYSFSLQLSAVIQSFRHKGLQELFETGRTRRIGIEYVSKCERILGYLAEASQPEDLDLPGLHFHPLRGSPPRWSVRVSGNYRITFGWIEDRATNVDFEDYH
jgi:proteic killer suppression protein